jgi:hypothetical protein
MAPAVVDAAPDQKWSDWAPYPAPPTETFNVCGTQLTFRQGDVDEVQIRERVRKDGTYEAQLRGESTLDILEGDRLVVDELDIGGPGRQSVSVEGVLTISLFGESLFLAYTPEDQAKLAALGLPDVFFWEHGKATFTIDLAANSLISVDHLPNNIVDICSLV